MASLYGILSGEWVKTVCLSQQPEQVDILISKNQALQISYLKHIMLHKLPWIETHENLILKPA